MKKLGKKFFENRDKAMAILQEEAELNEIVQLVGKDSLSPNDQLTLETARILREDFLQQNAFADIDSYSDYGRQLQMLSIILDYDRLCRVLSRREPPCTLCSASTPVSAWAVQRTCLLTSTKRSTSSWLSTWRARSPLS